MSTVAIIPIKRHSTRLANKNCRWLAGRPLMDYTIRAALECPLIDDVVVSTEDSGIAEVAEKCGARVPVLRPAELATDTTQIIDVLRHMTIWLEDNEEIPKTVVFMKATIPFREETIVTRVVRALLENPNVDSAVAAAPTIKKIWRQKGNGSYFQFAPDIDPGLQADEREFLFREDSGVACASRSYVIRNWKHYIGDKVKIVTYNDKRSDIDIDDIYDFWLAKKVATEWNPVRDLAPIDLEDALYDRSD